MKQHPPFQSNYHRAIRILLIQLTVILILAVLLLLIVNIKASYSALLGGLTWLIPSLYFTIKLFANNKVKSPQQMIKTFYANELIKLLLSAILFVLAIKLLPVNIPSFLGGYVAAILAFWLALPIGKLFG